MRVELADGGADQHFLRAGDRIDLIAGAADTDPLVGAAAAAERIDDVRVLEVRPPPSTGLSGEDRQPGTVLIVSADASRADLVTSLANRKVLAARDKPA